MFNLKQGTLKFLLNASIDTLPTQASLCKWKKSTSDQCKLCKATETTSYILNNCKVSLDNGKCLFLHNNIVHYIVQLIDTSKFKVYSDIPGFTVGGGSIPPELRITAHKLDIVIEDKKCTLIHICEWTVPIARNIDIHETERSNRYAHFLTHMRNDNNFLVTAFEIHSLNILSILLCAPSTNIWSLVSNKHNSRIISFSLLYIDNQKGISVLSATILGPVNKWEH